MKLAPILNSWLRCLESRQFLIKHLETTKFGLIATKIKTNGNVEVQTDTHTMRFMGYGFNRQGSDRQDKGEHQRGHDH